MNEFAANPQVMPALIVFLILSLPTFGYFYNKLIDRLKARTEHTSMYVAIGVSITLLFGGLLSWRAMLMFFVLFGLSGLPMIAGEFKRTEERKTVSKVKYLRRKRLPYAANSLIADAWDAAKETQRLINLAIKNNGKNVESALALAEATSQINLVMSKLNELRSIQSGNGEE